VWNLSVTLSESDGAKPSLTNGHDIRGPRLALRSRVESRIEDIEVWLPSSGVGGGMGAEYGGVTGGGGGGGGGGGMGGTGGVCGGTGGASQSLVVCIIRQPPKGSGTPVLSNGIKGQRHKHTHSPQHHRAQPSSLMLCAAATGDAVQIRN
jgi:hypothetical protein